MYYILYIIHIIYNIYYIYIYYILYASSPNNMFYLFGEYAYSQHKHVLCVGEYAHSPKTCFAFQLREVRHNCVLILLFQL